jgi:osmoprotectant transport system permease protein
MIDVVWIANHLGAIGASIWEHMVLTGLAVAIGFLISIVLGLLAYRFRWSYGPITAVTGLLYTIPSLALFAILVPFTGFTLLTAEIGLVSYTLLILIRNIVAGLDGVPPDAREAATAMGYTPRQRLFGVELPLAIPVIFAGLRVATVTTIGLVTVTGIIGQGGLGQQIFLGLQLAFPTRIYVGAIGSVLLAVAADLLLLRLQQRLTPWDRSRAG